MPDPSVEKKKLNIKEVGIKGAIVHFWTYYKWWVIIPVIVIGVLGSMLYSYLSATKKAYLNIAIVNGRYESQDVLFQEYQQQIGKKFIIDSTFHAPTNEDSIAMTQDMTASVMKLDSLISGGVVDIVITNSRSIKEYGPNGVRDLRDVLTDEQIRELDSKEMIFYLEPEDGSASYPAAINITGLEYFEPAYAGSEEKHYLMLSACSEKKEEEKLLLEYLFFS
ncbi:MAG: hypothetical protein J5750_07910 [Clostridiales bacterium]|nr:hypothetical protein [Clostridiales bacterium]